MEATTNSALTLNPMYLINDFPEEIFEHFFIFFTPQEMQPIVTVANYWTAGIHRAAKAQLSEQISLFCAKIIESLNQMEPKVPLETLKQIEEDFRLMQKAHFCVSSMTLKVVHLTTRTCVERIACALSILSEVQIDQLCKLPVPKRLSGVFELAKASQVITDVKNSILTLDTNTFVPENADAVVETLLVRGYPELAAEAAICLCHFIDSSMLKLATHFLRKKDCASVCELLKHCPNTPLKVSIVPEMIVNMESEKDCDRILNEISSLSAVTFFFQQSIMLSNLIEKLIKLKLYDKVLSILPSLFPNNLSEQNSLFKSTIAALVEDKQIEKALTVFSFMDPQYPMAFLPASISITKALCKTSLEDSYRFALSLREDGNTSLLAKDVALNLIASAYLEAGNLVKCKEIVSLIKGEAQKYRFREILK